MSFWSVYEIDVVIKNYPNFRYISEFNHLIPNRTARGIQDRARLLKLRKIYSIQLQINKEKSQLQIVRNKTVLGRDMNYEFAKTEVLTYKSKQELYKLDNSLYQFIHKNKLWDELCEHMIIGMNFNYPQTFLYYCIKQLYPNFQIIMNDRTAIYPKEIDVYIPELKIGFEYDGIIYHSSDKDKLLDNLKDEICISKGIKLYRIPEISKTYPEKFIIDNLQKIGYSTECINVHKTVKITFSKQYTKDDVISIVSRYKEIQKFKKDYPSLYSFLLRKNLMEEYANHLMKPKEISKDDILRFMSKCKYKNEILTDDYGKLIYSKFKRTYKNDEDINKIYNTLKKKNIIPNTISRDKLIEVLKQSEYKKEIISNRPFIYAYQVYRDYYKDSEIINLYNNLKNISPDTRKKNVRYYYSYDNINWIHLEIIKGSSLNKECIKNGWVNATVEKMLRLNTSPVHGVLKGMYFKREYL